MNMFTESFRQALGAANTAVDIGAPVVANSLVPGLGLFVTVADTAIDASGLTPAERLALKEPELAPFLLPAQFLNLTGG